MIKDILINSLSFLFIALTIALALIGDLTFPNLLGTVLK
jgi:hypothetical protein